MHKATQRQPRHVGNIVVGKAPAHIQHRAAPFQKNAVALDRHGVRSGRDDFKLTVG
jgi:hypothetical protein